MAFDVPVQALSALCRLRPPCEGLEGICSPTIDVGAELLVKVLNGSGEIALEGFVRRVKFRLWKLALGCLEGALRGREPDPELG